MKKNIYLFYALCVKIAASAMPRIVKCQIGVRIVFVYHCHRELQVGILRTVPCTVGLYIIDWCYLHIPSFWCIL